MLTHLKRTHTDVCVSISDRGSFLISGVTPATKYLKVFFIYRDVFYCCCEIQNGIFYCVLQYIGPAEDAAKFRYKVEEFFNKERTENLAVIRSARRLDEDLSEVHNSGNCVKLHPQQFNGFINENGELTFLMEIRKIVDSFP